MTCRTTAYATTPTALRPYVPAHDDYPQGLEEIIARCLARDANDRFLSVAEIRAVLRRFAAEIGMTHDSPTTDALDFETRLNRAVSWMHLGAHDRARHELRDLLRAHQHDGVVWYNLGNSYVQTSEYPRAVECFENAVAITPDDAQTWSNLAYAAALIGDDQKALRAAGEAVRIDPTDVSGYINQGFVFGQRGEHERALHAFQVALSVQPSSVEALCAITVALTHLGRTTEAREHINRARLIDPTHPRIAAIERELQEQASDF
jgi:tetratricopeptide (TPR) repeat protein